jgi:hypothetical protein
MYILLLEIFQLLYMNDKEYIGTVPQSLSLHENDNMIH